MEGFTMRVLKSIVGIIISLLIGYTFYALSKKDNEKQTKEQTKEIGTQVKNSTVEIIGKLTETQETFKGHLTQDNNIPIIDQKTDRAPGIEHHQTPRVKNLRKLRKWLDKWKKNREWDPKDTRILQDQ